MANIIRSQKLVDNNRTAVVKIVGILDNSAMANSTILDVSQLAYSLNTNGYIMSANVDYKTTYRTTIKRIWGQGGLKDGRAILKWQGRNGFANTEICTFHDSSFDYNFASMGSPGSIPIEDSANSTGDIVMSLDGNNLNDSFTLFIELHKDGRDFDQGQTRDPLAFNNGL
jgi:hypothetical protein